ncbi:hypothetical protein ACO0QE_001803 [Hanseniaspora vineae]
MNNFINISTQVGESIPPQTEHAVSVCLPTWEANVGYEEGDPDVINKLTTGYPRFFIHLYIKKLCSLILTKFSRNDSVEQCLIFSSYNVAKRCREYIKVKRPSTSTYPIRILQLSSEKPNSLDESRYKQECKVSTVFVHKDDFKYLKEYWQHAGEGISSRVAEYMLRNLFDIDDQTLQSISHEHALQTSQTSTERKTSTIKTMEKEKEGTTTSTSYIEQRFGRAMDMSMGEYAKKLIKKRIAMKVVDVEEDAVLGGTSSSTVIPVTSNEGRNTVSTTSPNDNAGQDTHVEDISAQFTEHVIVVETNSTEQNPNMTTSNLQRNRALESELGNQVGTHSREGTPDLNDSRSANQRFSSQNSASASAAAAAAASAIAAANGSSRNSTTFVDPNKDVYLFPSGMAAIFTAHRLLLELDSLRVKSRMSASSLAGSSPMASSLIGYGPPYKKTVMFGFPYTDTLSILRKFNHTHFLPNESDAMSKLEHILQTGEQILAVFTETPSNPLLKMGDIFKLKELSLKYGFYIIVDDTIGGFINVDILPHADIVVSSLTKIFSGDSNVLAGSLVLNKHSRLYDFAVNQFFPKSYEDLLWCEDAICLERNSRNFVQRSLKVNTTTEWLIDNVLKPYEDPNIITSTLEPGITTNNKANLFAKIYYPKHTSLETKKNYENVMTSTGGYGEVFSLVFHNLPQAKAFFNNLKLCKGPSLGTNFTLSCPYTIIAHYNELEEVAKYDVAKTLVRVSVGLEDQEYLEKVFLFAIEQALKA